MPRAIKPKKQWHAGGLVEPAKLTATNKAALCEAVGLDPRARADRLRCQALVAGVAEAIGYYRLDRRNLADAPRAVHQRAALNGLQNTVDTLITTINDLDDFSLERLTAPRRGPDGWRIGLDTADMLVRLRSWSGMITMALQDLDGAESRGRVTDSARNVLVQLLVRVFTEQTTDTAPDVSDLAEFLCVGCRIAGARLTPEHAEVAAAQLLHKTTP